MRRNTIGRRNTRVRMKCRAFPLWLERQSSSLLSVVRFRYQLGQLFAPLAVKIYFFQLFCYVILAMSRQNRVRKLINVERNNYQARKWKKCRRSNCWIWFG